jgi:hypothetical protein
MLAPFEIQPMYIAGRLHSRSASIINELQACRDRTEGRIAAIRMPAGQRMVQTGHGFRRWRRCSARFDIAPAFGCERQAVEIRTDWRACLLRTS